MESKKVISYALFKHSETPQWLFNFYLRGLVWNVKMNALIYPEWTSHVEIDAGVFSDYDNIIYALRDHYGMTFNVNQLEDCCKCMLWRLKPIFEDTELVLCRDADAITTWRERMAVGEWLNTPYNTHGISDNTAHTLPLMGGMIGFKSAFINNIWKSWSNFMALSEDLSKHGSDQDYLMKAIYPFVKDDILVSNMYGRESINRQNPLWESDLTCRHIGSAGVVEMEIIRFFKKYPNPMLEVEQKYSHIFYWL